MSSVMELVVVGGDGGRAVTHLLSSLLLTVKTEEPASMEMDSSLADKEESCYDSAEAAFSDDDEEMTSKSSDNGKEPPPSPVDGRRSADVVRPRDRHLGWFRWFSPRSPSYSGFDDESLYSLPVGKKREFRFHPIKEPIIEEPVDITPYLEQLEEPLREKVVALQKERYAES